jgi:tetratricopeptide (TPR) repeat protein
MIRVFAFVISLVFSASPAWSAPDDPRLDRLFLQLREARTEAEIATLMSQIGGIWLSSGSDTIDLLMQRAQEASEKGAPDVALDLLDRTVQLAPRYAEAWRRRGAVQAAEGNGEEALGDLREALQIEPRHFGALNEIARILEEAGDTQGAAEALRRLNELIPNAEGLRQRLQKLEGGRKPQGDPI